MNDLKSDVGPYAMVPLWILRAGLTPAALVVWTVLSSYTSTDDTVWPSVKKIGLLAGLGERTVNKAVAELVEKVGVEVFERHDDSGRRTSNGYKLRFTALPVRTGAPAISAPSSPQNLRGHPAISAEEQEPEELEPKEPEGSAGERDQIPHSGQFQKPTVEDCRTAAQLLGMPPEEGEKFWLSKESNGWKVGDNPMVNWQASLGKWKHQWQAERNQNPAPKLDPSDVANIAARSLGVG